MKYMEKNNVRKTILVIVIVTLSSSKAEEEIDYGFRSAALKVHNHYRTQNNATPLKLDPELNRLAHAHAEKLADQNTMYSSQTGFDENLWSHRGELLALARNCEYAIKNWYTGSKVPGRVESSVNSEVLRSNSVTHVGFGVGTSEKTGEGYTVVVAFYS